MGIYVQYASTIYIYIQKQTRQDRAILLMDHMIVWAAAVLEYLYVQQLLDSQLYQPLVSNQTALWCSVETEWSRKEEDGPARLAMSKWKRVKSRGDGRIKHVKRLSFFPQIWGRVAPIL